MSFNTAKVVFLLNVVHLCIFKRLDHAFDCRSLVLTSLLLLDLGEKVCKSIAFWLIA